VWALSQLLPREAFAKLAAENAATESNASVREEWGLASLQSG
jgi:hypothetical protein